MKKIQRKKQGLADFPHFYSNSHKDSLRVSHFPLHFFKFGSWGSLFCSGHALKTVHRDRQRPGWEGWPLTCRPHLTQPGKQLCPSQHCCDEKASGTPQACPAPFTTDTDGPRGEVTCRARAGTCPLPLDFAPVTALDALKLGEPSAVTHVPTH